MSVSPRRYRKDRSPAKVAPQVVASDLVKANGPHDGEIKDHPLAGAFLAWLTAKQGDKATPTKRQAAEFLAAHPQFRVAAKAA